MIIFRWQAHDSKVEMGVSPQRNTNFSHQGREKKTFDFWGFHLVWFENARFASTKRSFYIRMSKKMEKCEQLADSIFFTQRHKVSLKVFKFSMFSHLALCLHI